MNKVTWYLLFILWLVSWAVRSVVICWVNGFNILIGRGGSSAWVIKALVKRNKSSEWLASEGEKLGL